ncbi:MAG: hypothetical protein JSV62_01745 [Promethearchaeota archaeon]|nr:MAG: hypothetical protein JSV62_01745 [Candidatus Lokiarchaeota archaeon]
MKLQFYETMYDKSKEYLSYLIEQILPKFTSGELSIYLEEIDTKPSKGKKESQSWEFEKIGGDSGKIADLSKLKIEQLKHLYQTFISKELNDRNALRWRFYQYIKYISELNIKSIKINRDLNPDRLIDFIIETEDKNLMFILCYDILELKDYDRSLKEINDYAKNQNSIPEKIIFAVNKTFRNIQIDKPVKIVNNEIIPELWIEWVEENCPFNKEDLLIVNDSELKLAGFNFTSVDDLLKFVFKYSNGGQISIYKQLDFFTEVSEEEPEVELIWKGLMLK